jgi:hypothetical protein
MNHPFYEEHDQAIEYGEFCECGWSVDQYLAYCDIVAQFRAALIIEVEGKDVACVADVSGEKMKALLEWVGHACARRISPNYDLVYALKRQIRYLEHNEYGEVGDLPYFYRSEADFRYEVEKHLFSLLTMHPQEVKLCTPYCSNRAHAVSLQNSLIAEKESIINGIEKHFPRTGGENAMYAWARKKEVALLQIDELDAQIGALQWRIEEFDNGGEFDASKNILYVYKGFIKCQRDHHSLTCVNAKVLSKNGKYIYLNVNYCKDCRQFFISYSEYLHYRSMYGILIAKIVMISNGEYSHDIDYLASESPLKLCGYSVSQAEGLTAQARQDLLRELIQLDIIKKPEIIRYLSWFIQMNGQKDGNEIARSKWEADLDYVRDLNVSKQATQLIAGIKPYPGYHKL